MVKVQRLFAKTNLKIQVCQLQVTLKETAHSRCWLFQKLHSNKLHDNLSKNKLTIRSLLDLSFLLSVRKFYGFHQCILQHTCRTVIAIRLNFLQQCIQIHQGSALDLHALITVQLQPYTAGIRVIYLFVIRREL